MGNGYSKIKMKERIMMTKVGSITWVIASLIFLISCRPLIAFETDEGTWDGELVTFEKSVIIVGNTDSTSSDSLEPILNAFSATLRDSIYE